MIKFQILRQIILLTKTIIYLFFILMVVIRVKFVFQFLRMFLKQRMFYQVMVIQMIAQKLMDISIQLLEEFVIEQGKVNLVLMGRIIIYILIQLLIIFMAEKKVSIKRFGKQLILIKKVTALKQSLLTILIIQKKTILETQIVKLFTS